MPTKKRLKNDRPFKLVLALIGLLILIILSSFLFLILKPEPTHQITQQVIQNPQPSGIYKGILPCADCPGITETIVLANDGTFILQDVYQDKSTKPFQIEGKWEIINLNILKLSPTDNSQVSYFQILENKNLQMLDSNMQKIDSPYNQTLTKQ